MIYYLVTERFRGTIRPMLASLRRTLRMITYEELLFERAGPIGHYIFTDLDRLSRYETENLVRFAAALRRAAPEARILNDPLLARDRVALLAALNQIGVNEFRAERLDLGGRPARYPVFLRAEDSHLGPETGLLHTEAEFDAALADLCRRGLPVKGRIAVGYAAEPGPDGYFRRYGAFNIGGRIIADELFIGDRWAMKDASAIRGPAQIAEELEYARTNPHQDQIRRAFAAGQLDFGRADYGIVGGRVQIYEINTNPQIPVYDRKDERTERRMLVGPAVADAFRALDTPLSGHGRVAFSEVRPGVHDRRWPRRRLVRSLGRRIRDTILPPPRPS